MGRYVLHGTMLALLAGAAVLRAGDPGDLFPSVSYDQAIGNASSTGAESALHTVPAPSVRSAAVSSSEASAIATAPAVVPMPTGTAGAPPKPSAGRTLAGSPRLAAPFWRPYSARLLAPLLSAEERADFNHSYGEILANANASDDTRLTAAGMLDAAAGPSQQVTPALRRYLLMQALRGHASVTMREHLADEFLPLVVMDHSLPVTQAKATTLASLANSATTDAPATPKLLDFTAEAYGDLALAQIEAGYPTQAQDSLKKAETWLARMPLADPNRQAQFSGVQYYLSHAQAATLLGPKLKLTLIQTPDDAAANTQLATLHLSLFADLPKAAACAVKSDKPEFQAFSKYVVSLEGGLDAVDPATPQGIGVSLDLCRLLLRMAPACSDAFDRYAIATYVKAQCDELLSQYKLDLAARTSVQTVQAQAQAILAASPPPAISIVTPTTPSRHTSRHGGV